MIGTTGIPAYYSLLRSAVIPVFTGMTAEVMSQVFGIMISASYDPGLRLNISVIHFLESFVKFIKSETMVLSAV